VRAVPAADGSSGETAAYSSGAAAESLAAMSGSLHSAAERSERPRGVLAHELLVVVARVRTSTSCVVPRLPDTTAPLRSSPRSSARFIGNPSKAAENGTATTRVTSSYTFWVVRR